MPTREKFAVGEYYHIYNRGVDGRDIVLDHNDSDRFIESVIYFNTIDPVKSLRSLSSSDKRDILLHQNRRLVEMTCICLNPNHYHFLIREINEGGVSEFMKRLSGGYTWYFNNRHGRSGTLFQGRFKSVHLESNEQLLHLSAYINLNDKAHQYSGSTAVLVRSSWDEYSKGDVRNPICQSEVILGQFKTRKDYVRFALSSLKEIRKSKEGKRSIGKELLIGKHFFE